MAEETSRVFEVEITGIHLGFSIAPKQHESVTQEKLDTLNNMQESFLVSLLSMSPIVFSGIDDIPYSHYSALSSKTRSGGKYPIRLIYIELLGVKLVAGLFNAESKVTEIEGGWLKKKEAFMRRRLCNIPLNEASDYLSTQSYRVVSIREYAPISKDTRQHLKGV
ncbi:hypothetical protein ACFJ9Q_001213 [Vibrio parahaemolyticus]|nr:hypothetical protein [Vibrio parahaemolyticus]